MQIPSLRMFSWFNPHEILFTSRPRGSDRSITDRWFQLFFFSSISTTSLVFTPGRRIFQVPLSATALRIRCVIISWTLGTSDSFARDPSRECVVISRTKDGSNVNVRHGDGSDGAGGVTKICFYNERTKQKEMRIPVSRRHFLRKKSIGETTHMAREQCQRHCQGDGQSRERRRWVMQQEGGGEGSRYVVRVRDVTFNPLQGGR